MKKASNLFGAFAAFVAVMILMICGAAGADSVLAPDLGPADVNMSLQVLTSQQRDAVLALGKKSLDEQIKTIGQEVNLELLTSDRKGGDHYFDSLGPAKHSLDEISDVEGLYGKAVCARGDGKPLIYLTDDAPPSTLMHEYIHYLQMKDVKKWCELDGRVLDGSEKRERALLYHRFEFEVLKTLWGLRDQVFLNFEDRIILVEGLSRENAVFKSLGVKALTQDEAKEIDKQLGVAHEQIHFLTWLTHSHDEAGAVLQKMEVLSLKSCVEQGTGHNEIKKINDCIQKRCSLSEIKCQKVTGKELSKVGDDLTARLIYSWLKPLSKADCDLNQFKDELQAQVEMSTGCWKEWYAEHAKKDKSLSLHPLAAGQVTKQMGAPSLPIDSHISFYEPANPESFIQTAYCYFIFQKVARFDSLPIDQFPYATLGASIALKHKKEYVDWLKNSSQGKTCGKLVKVFTGEDPSQWESFKGKKNYVLIMNSVAALTGGTAGLKKVYAEDLNHERLHIIFGEDEKIREKVRAEWQELSDHDKDAFKQQHPSYDFTDEDILYREYFSYTRQGHPKKLF